jgi:hypothetical protein
MKKTFFLIAWLLFAVAGSSNLFAYSGGNGTKLNPYLISSKADMEQLATNVNGGQTYSDAYFLLTRDLTGENDIVTTVAGNYSSSRYFGGVFDGGGHEIAVNIVQQSGSGAQYAGIFGYTSGATIRNLGVRGSVSSSSSNNYSYSGGICGYAGSSTTISNCYNTGNISASSYYYSYSGGICGYSSDNTISNCYNTGNISSSSPTTTSSPAYSGGICGYSINLTTTISNCYNIGNISASKLSSSYSSNSGGICGSGCTIKNCFSANNQITNTYDAARNYIGRIGGASGSYENCYALDIMSVNGDPISSQSTSEKDGKDMNIASLQSQSWLKTNLLWDFNTDWCLMGEDQFPQFKMAFPNYNNTLITFEAASEIVYGDQLTLSATSNNTTTPVVYTSSDNSIAEIVGNSLISRKAGTVTVTASQPTGNNYFSNDVSVNISIKKKALTVTANSISMAYGDAVPVYSCQYEGFVNGDAAAALTSLPVITCSATSQSNAGQYAIIPSGAAAQNYTFTYQQGLLTIEKRNLQVIPDNMSRIYGNANPAFTFSYTGFVNGNTAANIATPPTVSTPATIYSSPGEYAVTCSGGNAANYTFTYGTGKLLVTQAPLTVSANNASRYYGLDNPAFTVSYSGFKNSDNPATLLTQPQLICVASTTTNTGTYPITVSGAEALNYTMIYVDGALTVNKAPVTVTANAASMIYGDAVPQYTCSYAGFANNETENVLSKQPTIACVASSRSNAGNYEIIPSAAEAQNYTFTYQQGVLTIQKRDLQVIPNAASKIYGDVNPAFTLSYTGFVNEDSPSVFSSTPAASTAATVYSDAGEYAVTCSGGNAANYRFVYENGILTVTKAPLTATANNTSRNYGANNPLFGISYSGFKNVDTQSSLSVQAQAVCAASALSGAGTYPITVSGAEALNYTMIYVDGVLTVNKIPLTVTANAASMIYGDAVPQYTCSYAGFANNETENVLSKQPTIACVASSRSRAGNYEINPSGAEAQNYTFTYRQGLLTIQKRDLQVVPNDASKIYGDANPTFTLSYTGFVNEDSPSVFSSTPVASTAATEYSDAGEYAVTCSGGNASNYTFTYETGKLLVTKAPLTAAADNKSRYENDPNPEFTITYTGFVNRENESALDILPQATCNAGTDSEAGEYPITVAGGLDNNYEFIRENGTLTILKATAINTPENRISVYPNPVSKSFRIRGITGETQIIITDIAGKPVLIRTVNSNEEIAVDYLPKGVYMVNVNGKTTKIVKN